MWSIPTAPAALYLHSPFSLTAFAENPFAVKQDFQQVKGGQESLLRFVRAKEDESSLGALALPLGGRAAQPPAAALACMGQGCAVYSGSGWSIHSLYQPHTSRSVERTNTGRTID